MSLNAEAIVVISGAVVALTQLAKWSGLPDKRGPVAVILLSLAGVVLYQFSYAPEGRIFTRLDAFPVFSAWVAVALGAAGTFGFTRSLPDAVTATKNPPPGAGASPTVKE